MSEKTRQREQRERALWSRRELLARVARGAASTITGCVALPELITAGGLLRAAFAAETGRAVEAPAAPRRRFVQIFLNGGWDTNLAIDPPVGARATSTKFQAEVRALETRAVTGKPTLVVGNGFLPAIPAFAALPTAFVNGIFIEVPAHDLAADYILTGHQSLSRSRSHPAFITEFAKRSTGFPPHVVIGGGVPLAETRTTIPPLQVTEMSSFMKMLRGPRYDDDERSWRIGEANELVTKLDSLRAQALPVAARTRLTTWTQAAADLQRIYDGNYAAKIGDSAELIKHYGTDSEGSPEALMAMVYSVLQTGLSDYVTLRMGNYDSHGNHLGTHLPEMRSFASSLAVLVNDLKSKPLPEDPTKTFADVTTFMITSEFTRTPTFNGNQGTDHWVTTSAILMGAGVKDGAVIGKTDGDFNALGWENGAAVAETDTNKILPQHLVAAIIKAQGLPEVAADLTGVPLDGVFV